MAEHLVSLGGNPLDFGPSSVLQHTAWRNHFRRQTPTLGFYSRVHFMAYLLVVYTVSPGATPVTDNFWYLAL